MVSRKRRAAQIESSRKGVASIRARCDMEASCSSSQENEASRASTLEKISLKMSEDADLKIFMDFLVEKTKDAFQPMIAVQVFREYLNEKSHLHDYHYKRFCCDLAPNMNEWNNYSIEARIRLMYALGGKVESDFLERIETHGTVELNKKRKITKYTSNDGILSLQDNRVHFTRFMDFLIQKTKYAVEPMNFNQVLEEFCRLEPDCRHYGVYYVRFHHKLAPNMDALNNYNIYDRIRLMFVLNGKVSGDFFKTIKTHGTVELDRKKKITKYVSNDGKLKLGGNIISDTRLMDFLIQKTRHSVEPMQATNLIFKEFSERPSRILDKMYQLRFYQKLAPNMNEWNRYSIEQRIRLMFVLKGKVADDFLKTIETHGTVELDEKRRIRKYTSNDGKLSLKKPLTDDTSCPTNIRFMDFLIQNTKDGAESIRLIYNEFALLEGNVLSASTYSSRFCKKLAPKMSQWSNYRIEDRIRMMFALKGKVESDFLAQMIQSGAVQLDENYRIVRYTSNNGKVELSEKRSGVKRRSSTKSSKTLGKRRQVIEKELSDLDEPEFVGIMHGYPKQEPVYEEIINQDMRYNNEDPHIPPEIEQFPIQAVHLEEPKFDPISSMNIGRGTLAQRFGTTSSESDGISVHNFLISLELILTSLESDTLIDLMREIKELRNRTNDEILPPDLVIPALQTCFMGITRKFRPEVSAPSKSAGECLRILKYSLLWLQSPLLYDLQKRVQEEIENCGADGKVIPIADIQQGIRNILFAVSI
ncbi:SPK domain-containing protein [Caenorhabditis elegans]|uniref:SPK domain-containing protein n=2 Tax=Caenorhabditis elegans TaxID=6239 RepID=H2KY62_CAEEL|nr:SPK domain-containing protein [Caenorhabditis elegans]CCD61294.2 SPK domain-containing protein [Caenorhabditis elegans]|eukprot:NP_001040628.2 Uncharacterized protein CELE_B0205.1 [Caenorhabditis elegans]